MQRYIECLDIVLLTGLLKFKRVIALIAVKDEQVTRSKYFALYILNKLL
jgi:hypothetical protein